MLTKKKNNKILSTIIIIVFLLLFIFIFIAIYINSSLKLSNEFLSGNICDDSANKPCEFTTFTVLDGETSKDVFDNLEKKGIIGDSNIVYLYNKYFKKHDFYSGNYKLPHNIDGKQISLDELLNYLSTSSNAEYMGVRIKFDEGDFARSYAEILAENIILDNNTSYDTTKKKYLILNYWNDEQVIRNYMNDYPFLTEDIFNEDAKVLLEGYLFPDTYDFYKYTTCDEITRKFLDRTLDIYNKYIDDFNNTNLSIHEIFTLASIVQWETGDPDDSLLVAGAFLNRIDNPEHEYTLGKLQSTVTACYAFDLNKSNCDKYGDSVEYTQTEDPYNTYTFAGFPPGPVCCPNEQAIYAALHPNQEAGYYFFVANMCDGGTAFASSYSEHMNNIEKYYLPCAE